LTGAPVVSVIMPLYNAEKYIDKAILSIQGQTFTSWEILIVDDCSTDGSAKIVKNYAIVDSRIKYSLMSKNMGAAYARNYGIKAARGRYIAFLDSDDEWLPDKLSKQLNLMSTTGMAFCYGAYLRVDEEGLPLSPVGVPRVLTYAEELKTNYVGCLTAIYDTNYFGKMYMPELLCHEDYPLWLNLLKEGVEGVGVTSVIARYCVRKSSLSSNKFRTIQQVWIIYRDLEKLSLVKSIICFVNQSLRALVRNYFHRYAIHLGWMHRVDFY
jgi:teichuronic acid biosynthesis glycosyltransferase TuaG